MKAVKLFNRLLLAFAITFVACSAFGHAEYTGAAFVAVLGLSVVRVAASLLFGVNIKAFAFLTIDPTDLTWNGKEIRDLNEAIFEQVFVDRPVTDFHTIFTDVKAKQQIAYLGLLGLVGKSGAGCDPSADSGSITMTEKFWDPKDIAVRFEECWKDLKEVFFVWGKNAGIKATDLTSTDYLNFVEFRLADAVEKAKLRITWFGDTDAANYDDSPAGIIKNGTDLAYFNAIDGLWKQIYAIVATTAARKTAISPNAGGNTYANQIFNATDLTNKIAHTTFQAMIDNADERLRDVENKIILCTWSMYNQYKKELKAYSAVESSYRLVQDGSRVLQYDGIDVIPFNFWDRTIKAYLDNGTKYYQPHRALMTTKENLGIATESATAFGEIAVFYDPKSRKNITESLWKMDAKIVEDYMIQVAY